MVGYLKCLGASLGQKALDHQFLVSLFGLLVKGIPLKVTGDEQHSGREASHIQCDTGGHSQYIVALQSILSQ